MEDLSKNEFCKLEQFKKLFNAETLTRQQIEFILDRKLQQPKLKSMPKFD